MRKGDGLRGLKENASPAACLLNKTAASGAVFFVRAWLNNSEWLPAK